MSVETAMKRIEGMGKTREIYEKREKLEGISKGYEWLLEKFPGEFNRVNAEDIEEEITKKILTVISD